MLKQTGFIGTFFMCSLINFKEKSDPK